MRKIKIAIASLFLLSSLTAAVAYAAPCQTSSIIGTSIFNSCGQGCCKTSNGGCCCNAGCSCI